MLKMKGSVSILCQKKGTSLKFSEHPHRELVLKCYILNYASLVAFTGLSLRCPDFSHEGCPLTSFLERPRKQTEVKILNSEVETDQVSSLTGMSGHILFLRIRTVLLCNCPHLKPCLHLLLLVCC